MADDERLLKFVIDEPFLKSMYSKKNNILQTFTNTTYDVSIILGSFNDNCSMKSAEECFSVRW